MPKFRRFDEVLRNRGYKQLDQHNDKNIVVIYEKKHLYNTVTIEVWKDSHKKGQKMTISIKSDAKPMEDMEKFKLANLDREYLVREAMKIHDCFEQLKQMKSPKHLYCF